MGSGASTESQVLLQTPRTTADSKGTSQPGRQRKTTSIASNEARDVMISYSHADKPFMLRLRDGLEKNGISVWVDLTGLQAGVDFLSKIGQAIIDSKKFISILSKSSIKSRYCQDELALAYISNKRIHPIGLCEPDELFPEMDTGMKLQLARFSWNLFLNEETFEEDLEKLVEKLKAFEEGKSQGEKFDESTKSSHEGKRPINKVLHAQLSFTVKMDTLSERMLGKKDFWEAAFEGRKSVVWSEFQKAFNKEFQKPLDHVFSKPDQEWLIGILRRELEVDESEAVLHDKYIDFCTVEGEQQPFWNSIQLQAAESYTMKGVFNMDSSVRVQAIENLGKFNSPAVVEALKDLLSDKDNNVRSVAAISLARTGAKSDDVIKSLIKCLNEKDRLVRESACLALGHLRAEAAVNKLVHLWRNDFISHVREAAQIALEQIGGEEANKAMHITKVLSDEIRTLTKES